MESPLKKRKIASQESQGSKVTSTPQRVSNFREQSPTISRIGDESSSSISTIASSHQDDISNDAASVTRKRLDFPENTMAGNVDSDQSSTLIDALNKNNTLIDESLMGSLDEDNDLDYDEFFSKIAKYRKKGHVWNLFRPIEEDEGSLYYLVLNDPREAGAAGTWFAEFCGNIPKKTFIYLIYRFVLDCAGYQQINVKKYFQSNLPLMRELVSALIKKVDNERCKAEVFMTGKFLFADNKSRLVKVIQKGIFNFIQKFILGAHANKLLYDQHFIYFVHLLENMFRAQFRQLIYTSLIFMIKLLTAICMVKLNNPNLDRRQHFILNNFMNTIFIITMKACRFPDHECSCLKLACIAELKLWIHYSPEVFVDHYNCVSMLEKLTLDEAKTVRLAALGLLQKIVQDEDLVAYLKAGPIESLVDRVSGRFCDVDINVSLKAIEVYTAMITYYYSVIQKRKKIFDTLVRNIYHSDFKMGSATGGCVIKLLNAEADCEKALLLTICELAINYHPTLKPLLIESCKEHTGILQNWGLIVEILESPHCNDVRVEVKETLSELFLESVHQVLTGETSKPRFNSANVTEIDMIQHQLIADKIYTALRSIVVLNRKHPFIIRNVLRIVAKIKPEYLTNDHIESVEQFLQSFMKFFNYWKDTEVLNALLDFLVFINDYVPRLSTSLKNVVQDLKKCVSEELYKSFKTRDNQTIVIAKKAAIVFSKFDLTEHIEWNKLLVSWDIIESNVDFLEDIVKCCHWSLVWKIRKLSTVQFSKGEQAKEVSLLNSMSKAYFSSCLELMGRQDQNIKFKGFERLCEVYIAFCQELENISKQIRSLENLKPCLADKDEQKQLTDVFDLSVVTCKDSTTQKYAMYLVNMAFLQVLPMDCISIIFKYYDKNYGVYGKLIETVMSVIIERNDNWMPMLLVNAICICFESFLVKHGVVDIRSQEAKDILSLSRKFAECKIIKNPKIASKLLFYAINYAVDKSSYEFLIFVRVFINEIQINSDRRTEILEHLKKKIPKTHTKSDPVLYFGEHLAGSEPKTKKVDQSRNKRNKAGRPPKTPKKLTIQTTKVKKAPKLKEKVMPKKLSQTTESEVSNDMTLHDTSSDDLDLTMSQINIST